jgi:hypothetical protein
MPVILPDKRSPDARPQWDKPEQCQRDHPERRRSLFSMLTMKLATGFPARRRRVASLIS